MMKSIKGQKMTPVAIVTAASKGMGAGCARTLANAGYKVVLMARSESIHDLAKELDGIAMQGDVTNPDDLQKLVSLAIDTYGRIDAVINNTGHPPKGDLLDIPDEDWHFALDLILISVVRLARLVTPIMMEQGAGAFVNITAFGAVEPNLGFPVSSAVRSSLSAFTKLYGNRYAKDGIRMNSILPGYIETWDVDDATRTQIPMNRAGTVEEIGQTALFLASDASGYITGQNIVVDGGITHGI
jgi:NAD(P)-dependent dehydrogenase (short-subunit alcohol dehydrogenase family)